MTRKTIKDYSEATYNAEMRAFYKDLDKVRMLVTSVPLNGSLSEANRKQLFEMRRQLWNKRMSLTLHRAFMGLPQDHITAILKVFDFDELLDVDTQQLIERSDKLVKDIEKKIKLLKLETKKHPRSATLKAQIQTMEKLHAALQAGKTSMVDFISTLDKVYANNNSGLAQSALDMVFMAAGAFVYGACTALLFPLISIKYYWSAIGWQMGIMHNIYEQNEILSYPTSFLTSDRSSVPSFMLHGMKNILILPYVLLAVRIMTDINAAALAVRDIYKAAKHGTHVAKSTTNAEYANKVKLLQALDNIVDLNSPAYTGATLLQRLIGTSPIPVQKINTYFELSTNQKSRLRYVDPNLESVLVKHFAARAKALKNAYDNAVKANDEKVAKQIFHEYENLHHAWDTILTPLSYGYFNQELTYKTIAAIENYVTITQEALRQTPSDEEVAERVTRASPVIFKYGLYAKDKLEERSAELNKLSSQIIEIQNRYGLGNNV